MNVSRADRLKTFEMHGYETVHGERVGRDPREMSLADLAALGHEKTPLLKAVRAKCLDCCSGQQSEVRKCTSFDCPLWPFRMRWNPFVSHEANPAAAERFRRMRDEAQLSGEDEDEAA